MPAIPLMELVSLSDFVVSPFTDKHRCYSSEKSPDDGYSQPQPTSLPPVRFHGASVTHLSRLKYADPFGLGRPTEIYDPTDVASAVWRVRPLVRVFRATTRKLRASQSALIAV